MPDDDVTIEPEDSEGGEVSSSFKLKELRDKLKETQKERDLYLDGWQRAKADYINLNKRAEDERKSAILYGVSGLVEELLPVVDSLEGALSHAMEPGLKAGLEQTYTKLMKALEECGVASVDPIGLEFNPESHESVEAVAVDSVTMDNKVTKVHQKGYSLNGRIIRPARVAVGHYKE